MNNAVIVLAMHGAPPIDFPKGEFAEMMGLQMRLESIQGPERAPLERRHADLEAKMRSWPRTAENDPFYAGSLDLADHLSRETGLQVILGFNEFCAPSLDEALEQAMQADVRKVLVVTTMMTPGGEHSEMDIPQAIQRARQRHPLVEVVYPWPFAVDQVAAFLASQIAPYVEIIDPYGGLAG
jgi:sirohydrochlorin cobaltochelatase